MNVGTRISVLSYWVLLLLLCSVLHLKVQILYITVAAYGTPRNSGFENRAGKKDCNEVKSWRVRWICTCTATKWAVCVATLLTRTINMVTDKGTVFNVVKLATNRQMLVPNNLEAQWHFGRTSAGIQISWATILCFISVFTGECCDARIVYWTVFL
jgi:hypothetical protein